MQQALVTSHSHNPAGAFHLEKQWAEENIIYCYVLVKVVHLGVGRTLPDVAVPLSYNDEVFSLGSDIKYGVSEDSGRRSSNKAYYEWFHIWGKDRIY